MIGCDDQSDIIIIERNERAKKIYRYVNEVARRLGEATSGCTSMMELFTSKIESERQKLRDHCEKLFFLDPINYGKKCLELLWRKVYYDTVSVAKKLRETDNAYDNFLFMHLVAGIGHFNHLMTRVQSEMNIGIKELDYLPLYNEDDLELPKTVEPTDEQYQLGKFVLYNCLIYLGDLSRYQVEISSTFDTSLAARYYLQAAQLDLTVGMPFNQLGNLYLEKNYNLDSVSYYIHCLNTLTPFEGAVGNLTKIFEKNRQLFESLVDSKASTQSEHMQITIANFLSLIEIWYLGKEDVDISQICNSIALQLKIAMDFTKMPLPDPNKNYTEYAQAIEEENVNPSYLNPNVIHNIVQICLFTIAKLNDTNEVKAFPSKAFTLAFLSQVLQKLLQQLESFGLKNPAHKYISKFASKYNKVKKEEPTKIETGDVINVVENTEIIEEVKELDENVQSENVLDTDVPLVNNGDSKNKKPLTKRRRRRRIASSESSDVSDAETETSMVGSEKSDSEELSDSTFQSDDESKSEGSVYEGSDYELDENACDVQELSNGDIYKTIVTEANNNKTNQNEPDIEKSSDDFLNIPAIENFLLGDNFLPSIKLLLDWILTEKNLILSCGDSGEALFQCVVDLLNIFIHYFNSKNSEVPANCKIFDYAKNIARQLKLEYKTIPLPEDIKLRGTNICKFDKDAAEWQILDKFKPTIIEENVIRILTFIDFGYQIAKVIPRIRFNRSLKIFYFKKVLPPKVTTKVTSKVNHKKNREWHNSKKQSDTSESSLLRRLGRLWLASQVRELERSGNEVPSLLAVDSATLYKHLRRVKQLVRTRNFIFLVPTVVLQELDDLKRERSSARDAIRWLEIQLKSGSRFLRTQRPGQSKPLPLLKHPRKAPPHVYNFIQILEFCNHFTSDERQIQGGNGDPDNTIHGKSSPILILLVGNEPEKNEEQYKDFSPTGTAQAAGISVKYIGDFYTKWRQTFHKNGKKR